jgi:GNAT superfamily N-acetyltransferase
MEIRFNLAKPQHIDDIVSMMKAFNAIDNYPFDEALRRKNLSSFIENTLLGRLWLITHEDYIVGYAVLAFGFSFEFKGRDAFIDELYIEESFRGKGIGGKTLDYILAQAKDLGINAIHLEVEKHNERGNLLYQKKGFKDHHRFLMTRFV